MTDEGAAPAADVGVREIEVRLLDGPNLYFPKPALKVSLALAAYATLGPQEARALAGSIGHSGGRPGRPGSETRQRWLMRLVRYVVRRLAREAGVTRIAVRARPGGALDEVVVAVPWRHRTRAGITGEALAPLLRGVCADGADVDEMFRVAASAIAGANPGPSPTVIGASVPVVSITGTNGKTTTTRMIGHIAMTAGLTTAWSSTDGVVVMGDVVEPGDYSGPAGARAVLATPGLDIAILETARGGLLFKGMGVTANDVSVVTNVSADHLGLQGIDTLDQLAEVKAIVTTVTKGGGWAVLNGEDPRVWAMRARTKAQPWAFALHADAPALREAVNAGGRGITVLDGDIVVLYPDGRTDRLAPVVDVPLTLAGLSEPNLANCLAAAAAALALGIERGAVVEGLRTFAPDPVLNSGRMNTYTFALDGVQSATVIVDLAHNEAGLEALLAVCAGLRAPGGRTLLALGAAGDRPDEALSSLGELSVRGAEVVVIAHKERYLRGRTAEEMNALFRAGMTRVGHSEAPAYPSELSCLQALLVQARAGDVVAVMCHAERAEIGAWLTAHGASVDAPETIRGKVLAAKPGVRTGASVGEDSGRSDAIPGHAAVRRPVLVLTGGPAARTSATGRALAAARLRAAFIEVDDVRALVVAGRAAPWAGSEGEAQARLGVENACDLARRFLTAGFEVVLADVLVPDSGELYRALLPACVVIHLVPGPPEVQERAAARPPWLTHAELDVLRRAEPAPAEHRIDVLAMSPEEQVAAVGRLWLDVPARR